MASMSMNFLSQIILRREYTWNAGMNAAESLSGATRRNTDPVMLQIEVTSKCNFKCSYCIVHNGSGKDAREHMDLATFQRILDRFPKSFYVQLQGQGEPLLHPQLEQMLEILEEQGRFSSIVTNGSLWDEDTSRRLLKAGVDVIAFSLDLCSPEEMERNRVGMSADKVEANLALVLALRDEIRPATAVGVSAVLFRDVYGDSDALKRAVSRIDNMGVDFLVVDPLAGTSCYESRYPEDLATQRLSKMGAHNLVPFSTRCEVHEAPALNFRAGRCIWPWMALYINHDGTVALCSNNHRINVGHIDDEDVRNFKAHIELRRGFADGRTPDACSGCQYLLHR